MLLKKVGCSDLVRLRRGKLKRHFTFFFLLFLFMSGASADVIAPLIEPRDDLKTRQAVRHRAELKPLADQYTQLVQGVMVQRPTQAIDVIFGPVLSAPPENRVLPLFGPEEVILPGKLNAKGPNNDHVDFHAVDEIGFVQFYFGPDGVSLHGAALYLRVDDQFIPLRSAGDFTERLRWEKSRLEALTKWLNEHLPKE